jgi:hypothetical protein
MGNSIASATQEFQLAMNKFVAYRRALKRFDQYAYDELVDLAYKHIAEIGVAEDVLPIHPILLTMQVEEHKRVNSEKVILEDHDTRIIQLENTQKQLKETLDQLVDKLNQLTTKLDRLEEKPN